MARDTFIAAFVLLLAGGVVLVASLVVSAVTRGARGLREHQAWRALWAPLVPGWCVIAAFVGWGVVDPDDDEVIRVRTLIVAGFIGLIWARALVRAFLSFRKRHDGALLFTSGLVAPRVHVDARVRAVLEDAVLEAALAHERAHVAHRDPLRIWLAQFVTDLQWPLPGSKRRLARWLEALEVARDDEARLGGARGADLAHAILTVAKLTVGTGENAACATLAGNPLDLRARIERLLRDEPPSIAPGWPWTWSVAFAFAVTAFGLAGGVLGGEPLLDFLAGCGV